jgi:hyaluronan synthase
MENNVFKKTYMVLTAAIIISLTILGLIPILLVQTDGYQTTILWIYSVSMSAFLIFMYITTYTYKPVPDMGYRPKVSVIVPAKNEEGVIGRTIRAVLDSDYPEKLLEVIAIDDGSTDNTAAEIQKIESNRLIFIKNEKNLGKRISLAKGFNQSSGEIVMCVDSDSFVEKDAIALMMQPFLKQNVVAVCGHGKAANKDVNLLTRLQHFWYQEMFRLIKGMESVFGCTTCCSGILAAYRRTAIKETMDEWYGEYHGIKPKKDESLLMRIFAKSQADDRTLTVNVLKPRKNKVVYQSNAIVSTIVPENMKQFVKQQLRWNRAWVYGTAISIGYMWKKPFPVPLYFYSYQVLIAILNPIVTIMWLVIKPINGMYGAAFLFLIGTTYISLLHGLNIYRYDKSTIACILYRVIFAIVAVFQSIVLVPLAWLTVWDGGWSTRSGRKDKGGNVAKTISRNDTKANISKNDTKVNISIKNISTGFLKFWRRRRTTM